MRYFHYVSLSLLSVFFFNANAFEPDSKCVHAPVLENSVRKVHRGHRGPRGPTGPAGNVVPVYAEYLLPATDVFNGFTILLASGVSVVNFENEVINQSQGTIVATTPGSYLLAPGIYEVSYRIDGTLGPMLPSIINNEIAVLFDLILANSTGVVTTILGSSYGVSDVFFDAYNKSIIQVTEPSTLSVRSEAIELSGPIAAPSFINTTSTPAQSKLIIIKIADL